MRVSIVIPTFERRASLERLLRAIAAQRYPLEQIEVIVVDDGSADGTLNWLRSYRPDHAIRVLTQTHAGPAAARNRGVAAAQGELVLFLDDDVVPDRDLVAAHVHAHVEAPERVVVGPMLPPESWQRPAWIRWEEDKLLDQYSAMTTGRYECTYRQFFTANASIARERFVAAGGFDVRLDRAEDVDLGYRLDRLGMRFVFAPSARAWHYPRRSFASWRRTPYRYGFADVLMEREKGVPALRLAFEELRYRKVLTRVAAQLCVGRPALFTAARAMLIAATYIFDAARLGRVASAALSGLFSLLYWQGVSDAVGDPDAVRRGLRDLRAAAS